VAPRIFGDVVISYAIAFLSSAAEAVKAEEVPTRRTRAAPVAKAVPASGAQATQAAMITLVAAVPGVSNIVADQAAAPEWLLVPSTAAELRATPDRAVKAATAARVAPGITVTAFTALVAGAQGAATTARAAAEVARAAITAVNRVVAAAADRRTSSPARSAFKLGKDGKKPRATVLSS
jgi:hypothetical protein